MLRVNLKKKLIFLVFVDCPILVITVFFSSYVFSAILVNKDDKKTFFSQRVTMARLRQRKIVLHVTNHGCNRNLNKKVLKVYNSCKTFQRN